MKQQIHKYIFALVIVIALQTVLFGARTFNGSNQAFENTTLGDVNEPPQTLSAWFTTDVNDSWLLMITFADSDGSTSDTWGVGIYTDGTIEAYFRDGTIQGIRGSTVISTGEWHHAMLVWETGNTIDLYLDGSLEADSVSVTKSVDNVDSFCIGRNNDSSPGQYWDGNVAEVGWWESELNGGGNLTDLYTNAYPPDCVGTPSGYWPLNEASGNAIDSMGSYDLTAINAPGSTTGPTMGSCSSSIVPIIQQQRRRR